MASIGRAGTSGELKRINYRDTAGRQQSLYLGKCSEKAAQSALAGFERVHEAHRLGSTLHPDGVRWLEGLNDRLHARVVELGLGVEPRRTAAVVTVGELLERFVSAAVVKPSTRAAYKQTTDSLREHLGETTGLATITPAHADVWRKSLSEPATKRHTSGAMVTKTLAPATVAKRVHVAKLIFKKAVRWGLAATDPFEHLRAGSQSNPERSQYVDADAAHAILAACPDARWRAIVALSRFAGLRCPSEIAELKWGDVDFERHKLTVRSPKTAHHEGHAVRLVPIAPVLQPILHELFNRAEDGAEAVVPRVRGSAQNLRTTFLKIITRAGVKPWPRLFQNMRASCATDWVERHPAHIVAAWLGHSPLIAAKHYLHVRDVHFDLAAGIEARPKATPTNQPTNTPTNPPTHTSAHTRTE